MEGGEAGGIGYVRACVGTLCVCARACSCRISARAFRECVRMYALERRTGGGGREEREREGASERERE